MKLSQPTLWYLYDFANSFASIVVFFYFPLLFIAKGGFELWMWISSSISTLVLILILPGIGRHIDINGKRMPFLLWGSISMSVILVILGYMFWMGGEFSTLQKIAVISLYGLFFLLYNGSVSIYTSLLRSVALDEHAVATSGKGMALGQLWNVIGLAAMGPIISSGAIIFWLSGKPVAFLLGAIASLVFALPFFLQGTNGTVLDVTELEVRPSLYKKIYKEKHIFYFLIGMMLVSDAILTFQIYVTSFFKKTYFMDDQMVIYVGMVGLFFCLVGWLISPWVVKKLKSAFHALMFASLFYSFCFWILSIIPPIQSLALVTMAVSGVFYGLVFVLWRVVYAQMTPKDEQTSYFSIYTLFERTASIIWPLLWTVTFLTFSVFWGVIAYRASIFILGIISLTGFFVLKYYVKKI
ncbi:MAG: hypothetical protein ACD_71C00092G0001 [uncultured bacterium (gcode 4)]|uniref:Major facilitator superfamily (MFS) profile domain-containing protein n=1 Tax=uncultured bacterium (gcode 4) TaxID=1234023 RepID=K1Z5T8_9BACT|nr:MAG: hypothetical protein ACD_71C00092G0001 [uncultured bacterium (gcode 4)]